MTVADLIKQLLELPMNALVIINDSENLCFRAKEAVLTYDPLYLENKNTNWHQNQKVVIINPEEYHCEY